MPKTCFLSRYSNINRVTKETLFYLDNKQFYFYYKYKKGIWTLIISQECMWTCNLSTFLYLSEKCLDKMHLLPVVVQRLNYFFYVNEAFPTSIRSRDSSMRPPQETTLSPLTSNLITRNYSLLKYLRYA